jgi:hypothetical protein
MCRLLLSHGADPLALDSYQKYDLISIIIPNQSMDLQLGLLFKPDFRFTVVWYMSIFLMAILSSLPRRKMNASCHAHHKQLAKMFSYFELYDLL